MTLKRHSRAGFTLLELLTVITIIGILAGIMLAAMVGFQKRARIKKADGEARNLAVAIRAYRTQYSAWPVPAAYLSSGGVWSNNNDQVVSRLIASGNPRRINFFEITNSTAYTLCDPFSSNFPYLVQINVYDNYVTVSSWGPDCRSGGDDDIWVKY